MAKASVDAAKRFAAATRETFKAIGDRMGGGYLRECYETYAKAQLAAEAKGADGFGGVVAGVQAVFTHLQKDQPDFFAEMRAFFRAGREDLLNILNGVSLTREGGAPGTPTQAMVTNSLVGLDFNAKQNDVLELAVVRGNEVIDLAKANDRQWGGRDGRD